MLTINQTNPDHTRDAANSRCGRLAAPMVCPYPTRSGPSDATPLAADRHEPQKPLREQTLDRDKWMRLPEIVTFVRR